jgi:DNA adenine methylase
VRTEELTRRRFLAKLGRIAHFESLKEPYAWRQDHPYTRRLVAGGDLLMDSDAGTTSRCPGELPITPILRWAGSKRKVLPVLASYWKPTFKRYVEPFAGSAALFFKLQPQRAILGDINTDLIDAYRVIRERPDDLHRAVTEMPRNEREYYRVRSRNTNRLRAFGRAVRFVYLNRYCFNGIYRTNAHGNFNVPYAHNKPGVVPPIEHFRRSATLLHRASLKAGDFGEVLSSVRAGDFVYLDPPYAVESRRIFREYDKREFSRKDLERLAMHLESIHKKGAGAAPI